MRMFEHTVQLSKIESAEWERCSIKELFGGILA